MAWGELVGGGWRDEELVEVDPGLAGGSEAAVGVGAIAGVEAAVAVGGDSDPEVRGYQVGIAEAGEEVVLLAVGAEALVWSAGLVAMASVSRG